MACYWIKHTPKMGLNHDPARIFVPYIAHYIMILFTVCAVTMLDKALWSTISINCFNFYKDFWLFNYLFKD